MKKPKERKKGFARLWELASEKRGLVVFSCTLSVLSSAVSFVPFIAVYCIIRELMPHFNNPAGLNTAYMLKLGGFAAIGAIAAIFLYFIALVASHIAAFSTLYKLKLDFTRHIASLPLGFHTKNSTGKLRKVVDENIEKLEGFIAHQLPDLAGSFAMPIFTLVLLFLFDFRFGIASLVPIALGYLIQSTAFGNKAAKVFIEKYQTALEDMNSAAVEYVRGISVVKAFNQTVFSFRRFNETIANYGRFVKAYTMAFETYMELFLVIINHVYLFLLPVIIFLSYGAEDYSKFAMAAVFYIIFSVAIPTPFIKLMYVSQSGRQIADGIERMDAVLDTEPLPAAKEGKQVTEYSISFENVTFSYNPENEAAALNGVTFTARQGELTALVGASGSGKSTLAHLIPRFYDVSDGLVKIGGTDIRDMSEEHLMSIVSFVFQEVFLFKQSILDNISIGNPAASFEEVVIAAKAAQCHEFVEKLPQGYETVIGTKNVHLSGGEKQRVVIARAILKNAPILVLDEATAFADPENEQKIQLALAELIKGKTVVIIAHRLSAVRRADKIVVIEKGKAVEIGKHKELINNNGRYRRLWDEYARALKWSLTGGEGA
ncbi:MAG: ABC transporter ATP-binding protein/permease, partial [Deferribacteraceae bacterium]|nr:ABC transporter ATP-binding protein/permease [Deferribacteraceae bacterium]